MRLKKIETNLKIAKKQQDLIQLSVVISCFIWTHVALGQDALLKANLRQNKRDLLVLWLIPWGYAENDDIVAVNLALLK